MSSTGSNTPSLQNRRLDSLAFMLEGGQTCAATSFDGKSFVFATNKNQNSDFHMKVINYVIFLVTTFSAVTEKSDRKQISRGIFEMREALTGYINDNQETMKIDSDSISLLERAFDKVSDAIIAAYLDPESGRSLPPQQVNAIKAHAIKRISLEGYGNKGDLHAEMKIAAHLIQEGLRKCENSYYVGISKKCCKNCEAVIKAINTLWKGALVEGLQSIEVRGPGHQLPYPSQIPPVFKEGSGYLTDEERAELETTFLEHTGAVSLEKAYCTPFPPPKPKPPLLHPRSPSPIDFNASLQGYFAKKACKPGGTAAEAGASSFTEDYLTEKLSATTLMDK
jgi:hypothetical protein